MLYDLVVRSWSLPAHTSATLQSDGMACFAADVTVVAVHMEGETLQIHRHATAGSLSLSPVVVV
jgi:hypothetical protein